MWKICGTLVGFMPKPQIKTPVKAKYFGFKTKI